MKLLSVDNTKLKKSNIVAENLFTTNNYKTLKGENLGYKTLILHLNPFRQNTKNINLCPFANGCENSCISETGNMFRKNVVNKRERLTELFLENRVEFVKRMIGEIEYNSSIYKNLAIRTNGTSDINFSKIKADSKNIYEHFEDNKNIIFYNYTKDVNMLLNNKNKNHYIVFSGDNNNWELCKKLLDLNYSVALVFKDVPSDFNNYQVVFGDDNDLIFTKPKGIILGLKFKTIRKLGANNKEILKNSSLVIQQ
jgi:hypothetical protein